MQQTSAAPKCRIITDTAELEALVPEWRRLWRKDPHATPFQAPEWLLPWWKCVGEGLLFAVAVFTETTLSGFLPLYIYEKDLSELPPERKLLLLGAGTSDYLGGVFDVADSNALADAALRCVLANKHRWDKAYLHQLPSESPLLSIARQQGWPQDNAEACFGVRLKESSYLAGKLADNLHYYRRRAAKAGTLRFSQATEKEVLPLFDVFVTLHTRRWQGRGEPGVLASEAIQRSHRLALPAMVEQGIAQLYSLTLDDRVIAVNYCLFDRPCRAGRSCYYYLNGFDPDYASLSPGTLLLGYVAEQAAAEGLEYLDMLRGQESYKLLWRAEARETFGFTLPFE